MSFVKTGDNNPITVIDPVDVDSVSTKKALDAAIDNVKKAAEVLVEGIEEVEKGIAKK